MAVVTGLVHSLTGCIHHSRGVFPIIYKSYFYSSVASGKDPECGLDMEVEEAGDSAESQTEDDDSHCYWYVCQLVYTYIVSEDLTWCTPISSVKT